MAQEVQLIVVKETTYTSFGLHSVERQSDGSTRLSFLTRAGELVHFPLPKELADEVGKRLLAPSLAVAQPGPNGDGHPV